MAIIRHWLSAAAVTAAVTSLDSPALAQPIPGEGFAATSAVAVVVKVPAPWYAPRFFVASKMRDTIPLYQSLPGLHEKAFSFARADGHYGGIYLWKDIASARAWFTDAWSDRVRRDYGQAATVEWFDTPILLVGRQGNGIRAEGARQP